jgi:hypothetical protein
MVPAWRFDSAAWQAVGPINRDDDRNYEQEMDQTAANVAKKARSQSTTKIQL